MQKLRRMRQGRHAALPKGRQRLFTALYNFFFQAVQPFPQAICDLFKPLHRLLEGPLHRAFPGLGQLLPHHSQLLQCGIELLFQPRDLLAHSQQILPARGIVLFHHFQELPDSGLLHQRDTPGMFPLRHCGGPGP